MKVTGNDVSINRQSRKRIWDISNSQRERTYICIRPSELANQNFIRVFCSILYEYERLRDIYRAIFSIGMNSPFNTTNLTEI